MASIGRHVMKAVRGSRRILSVYSLPQPVISGHTQPLQHTSIIRSTSAAFHTSIVCNNENIINIQDEDDFETRVLNNQTPVVVDFHAGWCGPCKLLGPRLESLISAKSGGVQLAKVDIDDNSDLAIKHGVEAVPTVLGVKNGKIVDKFVGLKDDVALEKFISNLTGE